MTENFENPHLSADADWDLVSQVNSSLDYDINKARAFVVALLEDVNDHTAAEKVNDILLGVE